jgi:hypothetical protein
MEKFWVISTLDTMLMHIVLVAYWVVFLASCHLKKFDIGKGWHTLNYRALCKSNMESLDIWLINGLNVVLW